MPPQYNARRRIQDLLQKDFGSLLFVELSLNNDKKITNHLRLLK